MTREDIFARLTDIFRNVFDDDERAFFYSAMSK